MLKRFLFLFSAAFSLTHFSIAQEEVSPAEKPIHKTGYFNTTEINYSQGFLKENTTWYIGLQTINGFRFTENIMAGIGVGVDQYFFNIKGSEGLNRGDTYLPVFTDIRFYMGKGESRPFFSQAVGYMFCLHNNFETNSRTERKNLGGILINPAFGLSTPLSDKTSMNVSLGYRYQQVTIKSTFWREGPDQTFTNEYTSIIPAHYFTLKAGLTF